MSNCMTEKYLIINAKSKLMKMGVYNQKYKRDLPGALVKWIGHPTGEQKDASSSRCGSSRVLR